MSWRRQQRIDAVARALKASTVFVRTWAFEGANIIRMGGLRGTRKPARAECATRRTAFQCDRMRRHVVDPAVRAHAPMHVPEDIFYIVEAAHMAIWTPGDTAVRATPLEAL